MVYEVYFPVADKSGVAHQPELFRRAFDELAEQFGFVETWPVYRPLTETTEDVLESELYRFQIDVPNTTDNRLWLIRWRQAQDGSFGGDLWMVRYRLP